MKGWVVCEVDIFTQRTLRVREFRSKARAVEFYEGQRGTWDGYYFTYPEPRGMRT